MTLFLDSSSLIKLYHFETGSKGLMDLFEKFDITRIVLSAISRIEFSSAIWKKVRAREISSTNALIVLKAFREDFRYYHIVETDNKIFELAEQLLDKYGKSGLRSLDSLQLASAVHNRKDIDLFEASDDKLKGLFQMLQDGGNLGK